MKVLFRNLAERFAVSRSSLNPVHEYFAEYSSFVWSELLILEPRLKPEDLGLTQDQIKCGEPETVVRLESYYVLKMPVQRLEFYVDHVRDRFRAVHPNEPLKFEVPKPRIGTPQPELEDYELKLRAYVTECLRELYREFLSQRAKEISLAKHVRETALIAGFTFFFIVAIMVWVEKADNKRVTPPIVLICMTGFIGGIVGHIRDLLTPSKKRDGYLTMYQLRSLYLQWPYKAVVGMLYALFFTLICLSGLPELIGFKLFPDMSDLKVSFPGGNFPQGMGLGAFFLKPLQYSVYAKLLVWCFICGFVQPFVPGVIDRLVSADPKKPKSES